MKIGLFFGTFNPIHIGHLIIANSVLQEKQLDQVWLVVTPHNPHKDKQSLLADYHRMNLVQIAIEDNPKLKASNVEFHLPQPNYTVHTLAKLKENYPKHHFSLILGEDNLRSFHKWYNYEYILEHHPLIIYPRLHTIQEMELQDQKDKGNELLSHPNVSFLNDTPILKISSSFIRKQIQEGKDVRYLLSEKVYEYVDEMHFYKKK